MSKAGKKRKDPRPAAIKRLLVANRSEIALRIMRTAREMGMETVAVYSDPDRGALHVGLADEAVALGGDTPATSYLDIEKIVATAVDAGADAVHPGYGFLAENPAFAAAVEQAGLIFVGPATETIETMGDKLKARLTAEAAGVPVIPAARLDENEDGYRKSAESLGFPVMVKAAAGGGGRGMRVVATAAQLEEAIAQARREAASAFADSRVYLEKLIENGRHIEIQVLGDGRGKAISLGERECSVQRRHQKIIEESPAPALDDTTRTRMTKAAVSLTRAVDYRGAGTVEFIVDENSNFYFLEMNTRLQVEHAVTEAVTATDLVRMQLDIAVGGQLPTGEFTPRGHAIECRVYAEDPANGFMPTSGQVGLLRHPAGPGIRVDSALFEGFEVPLEYDPMLAKVVAWAPDRSQAIARMSAALAEFSISGLTTNLDFLIDLLADEDFAAAGFTTTTVEQRYGHWQPGDTSRREGVGPAEDTGPTSPISPWKSLGRWRLGSETQAVSYRARTAEDADGTISQTHRFEPQVISPMPGKVIEVLVADGDEVEADAPLLLLEAMKMEQTIRAPSPARVKSINIEAGTMVGPGQVLVILEEV